MNLIIILFLIIAILLILLLTRKHRDATTGICATVLDQTVRKSANKEKAATLLKERGELSNADIRQALGVSDRSAVRYLDELEEEGRVEQIGDTGRGVLYRLK